MASHSAGRNGDYSYDPGDRQDRDAYREFDRCSLYQNRKFEELCDPEVFLSEYSATQQNHSDYEADMLCDGCLAMDAFMTQWLEDAKTFHGLVHGSLTVEE